MNEEELDEELTGMYGSDDDETAPSLLKPMTMFIQPKGKFQEFHINGQKVLIPDASIIVNMETTIRILKEKIVQLEHNLVSANFNIRKLEGYINKINKDLNNKISYDS